MQANLFWFGDGQWARIEPFIPSIAVAPSRRTIGALLDNMARVSAPG